MTPRIPYTTSVMSDLLCEFRNKWNATPENQIQRDLAQLFTGKTITGSVIGLAWLGAVERDASHRALAGLKFDAQRFDELRERRDASGSDATSGHHASPPDDSAATPARTAADPRKSTTSASGSTWASHARRGSRWSVYPRTVAARRQTQHGCDIAARSSSIVTASMAAA